MVILISELWMSLDFPSKFLSCGICLMMWESGVVILFGSHFFHFFVFSGGVMIYIDRIEVVNMLAPCAGMVPIYFCFGFVF